MNIPSDTPIYAFIKRELRSQIDGGELPEGARVPSEFELARTYGVSRNPTRQALRDLELEGYLVRHPGRGSFVASPERRNRMVPQGQLNAIALSLPLLESVQFRLITQGFIEGAAANGYHAVICLPRREADLLVSDIRYLRVGGIRGLALYPHEPDTAGGAWLESLQKEHFPVVLVERRVAGLDTDVVAHDHEALACDVTRAMMERGHRRIAFVLSGGDAHITDQRLAGYRRALCDAGCSYEQGLVVRVPHPAQSAFVTTGALWDLSNKPEAVICESGLVAGLLSQQLMELSPSGEAKISVAALEEDSYLATADASPVMPSRQARLIGWESARVLINRIKYPHLPTQCVLLKGGVKGESGAPVSMNA